jgi:N-acetylneuraminic acid mutarotase
MLDSDMRKTAATITLTLVFLITLCIIADKPVSGASADFWVKRAPMPNGEFSFEAVSVNEIIYAVGYNFTYMFDPATDSWVSKTPMPTHQQGFAIAACQDKIYVIGGWNSTNPNTGIAITLGTNEMYDPATDTWTTKASMPMPTADMEANVVDGKIYVISGLADIAKPTLSSSNWVYDPSSNSWSTAAPIPTSVFDYASAVVDNKIYIEGGEQGSSSYYSSLNQIFDPKTNSWALGDPLPASLHSASAGATTGVLAPAKLYVIGGTNNGYDGVTTTQIYDPQTGNWTLGTQMPTARKALAVAVVNDTLYALGGVSWSGPEINRGTVYAVNEEYIPLDYQGPTPSPYVPTPSPYPTRTPNPTPSPSTTPSPSEKPTASPSASPQPTQSPEPFPTATFAFISVAVAVVVLAGLWVYFKKRKREVKS